MAVLMRCEYGPSRSSSACSVPGTTSRVSGAWCAAAIAALVPGGKTVVGMPLTTVSDYVQTMTSRGHARRWRNPVDSRSFLVALTDEGLAAHSAARVSFAKVINRLRRALPIPEQEVIRALHALDDAIGQVLAELAAEDRRQRQPAAVVARASTRPGKAVHY
jgi:DNA-binding MarR family transcriptional regulator